MRTAQIRTFGGGLLFGTVTSFILAFAWQIFSSDFPTVVSTKGRGGMPATLRAQLEQSFVGTFSTMVNGTDSETESQGDEKAGGWGSESRSIEQVDQIFQQGLLIVADQGRSSEPPGRTPELGQDAVGSNEQLQQPSGSRTDMASEGKAGGLDPLGSVIKNALVAGSPSAESQGSSPQAQGLVRDLSRFFAGDQQTQIGTAMQDTLGNTFLQRANEAFTSNELSISQHQKAIAAQILNDISSRIKPLKKPAKPSMDGKDCLKNGPRKYPEKALVTVPMLLFEKPCEVLVNLMTTFISSNDPGKVVAQENTLRAFQRLRKHGVRGWLFTTDPDWVKRAMERGVDVVTDFRLNNANTPCLSYIYNFVAHNDGCSDAPDRVVFDGYMNGDILFADDFAETMRRVAEVWGPEIKAKRRRGVLVIGHRFNKPIGATTIRTEAELVEFGKDAKMFQSDAQDFFIYSRGAVDWETEMPGFVVGRPAYDNWLVDNAYHRTDVDLIDGTNTIRAVHETDKEGNMAGHKPRPDKTANTQAFNPATQSVIRRTEWDHGKIYHAHFRTAWVDGRVSFFPGNKVDEKLRRPIPPVVEDRRPPTISGNSSMEYKRIAVGVAADPLRCMLNHPVVPQSAYDEGQSMDLGGWQHHLSFWAVKNQAPGTIRIAVGTSDAPSRAMLNHPNQPQSFWNNEDNTMSILGWQPAFDFWAFDRPLPGTMRICVGHAEDSGHRSFINHDKFDQATWDSGSVNMSLEGWVQYLEFWAYPSRPQ